MKKGIFAAALIMGVALFLAVFASPFASSSPDGLEKVAEQHKFVDRSREHKAPVGDYAFPGVKSANISTALAGLTGTCVVCGIMVALGFMLTGGRLPKKHSTEGCDEQK